MASALPSRALPESDAREGAVIFSLLRKKRQRPAAPHEPARGDEVDSAWLAVNRGDVIVIDVRNGGEWDRGRLADAVHIPLADLHEGIDQLEDREATYVLMCRSGRRSMVALRAMRRMGFTTCFNLRGGILAWAVAGHPVIGDEA